MFSRNDPSKPPTPETKPDVATKRSYIAAEVSIQGNVSCTGDLQLDGTIKGDLDCESLHTGPEAAIDGTVRVNKLLLNGTISGQIEAKSVQLGPSAQMHGDIVYESLAIDEGATFEGNLNRRRAPTDDKVTVLRQTR